jgi:hypothetical protein
MSQRGLEIIGDHTSGVYIGQLCGLRSKFEELAEHSPHALKPESYCEIADSIDEAFGMLKS